MCQHLLYIGGAQATIVQERFEGMEVGMCVCVGGTLLGRRLRVEDCAIGVQLIGTEVLPTLKLYDTGFWRTWG